MDCNSEQHVKSGRLTRPDKTTGTDAKVDSLAGVSLKKSDFCNDKVYIMLYSVTTTRAS